ncbi:MAG TPA: cytochrome b/b6 domain-containing protein [Vicinamibacterales bacterium]|nr:cytochrome b/b6 domain-containing protein [Vicinamibacterales bacterium]
MQAHAAWVRASHWIAAASVATLAVTGVVILMAHPRLYWGDAGNDLTPALVELPISRNYRHGGFDEPVRFFEDRAAPVSASRTYDIFNQNGWGRSLHFLAAWCLVIPGVLYVLTGAFNGHFRRQFWPRTAAAGRRYSALQGVVYGFVVFVAAPVIVLTGLTMSPAVTAAWPMLLTVFGGHQSARTIHFAVFVVLALFVVIHVAMVARAGFRRQMRAMTFGD